MAIKWTADRNEKLLMLIVSMEVKMNPDRMAALWVQEFPNETFKPTARAISEHIGKLKSNMAGSGVAQGSNGTPRPKTTPKSATKRAAAKTPSSSNKKTRTSRISEEDDSEEEEHMMEFSTPIIKRERSVRSANGPKKSYIESDGEDSIDKLISSSKAARNTDNTPRDSASPTSRRGHSIARSKKDRKKRTDVSSDEDDDYQPEEEFV